MNTTPGKARQSHRSPGRGTGAGLARFKLPLVALAAALLATACVYSNRNYAGPKRPASEVATISFERNALEPLEVNGKPAVTSQPSVFTGGGWNEWSMSVLPGRVELTVALVRGLVSKANQRITFNALAGREYVLDFWVAKETRTWQAYIKDKVTNRQIAQGIPYDQHDTDKNR